MSAGTLPGPTRTSTGGEEGVGRGRLPHAGGCVGLLLDRRRTISAWSLAGSDQRLRPRPRSPTRPFLGPVFPRGLSPENAALGGGKSGPQRLPRPAPRLRVGLSLSELCQRTDADTAGGRSRL